MLTGFTCTFILRPSESARKAHVCHVLSCRWLRKTSLLSLPDEPHQPKDIAFSKRTLWKSKPVLCYVAKALIAKSRILNFTSAEREAYNHAALWLNFAAGRPTLAKIASETISEGLKSQNFLGVHALRPPIHVYTLVVALSALYYSTRASEYGSCCLRKNPLT